MDDPKINELFFEYEKAFNELDIRKTAGFFAETFISAGPKGTITQSKAELLEKAEQAATFYKSVGQTSAKILTMEETPISGEYVWVKVHWGMTFKKTGDKPIEFDVSYFVQKSGDEPKIIMFISHEDEQEAMTKLGLMG
jgi:hypothetical protein